MQKFIVLVFLFVLTTFQAQDFKVAHDTVIINIKGRLNQGIKNKKLYYCFFAASNGPFSSEATDYFYILSAKGKILDTVPLPNEMQDIYKDLHVRNHSVISKSYYEDTSYFLDEKSLQWVKINDVDDVIFQDERFYVTYLDFGEWGGTVWFRDKRTGLEYEFASDAPVINKVDNKYYITTGARVSVVDNPLVLKQCDKNYYYSIVRKGRHKQFYEGSHSIEGVKVLFQKIEPDPWNPKFQIATSFVHDNQLYSVCTDSLSVNIYVLTNGKIDVINHVEDDILLYDSYNQYRGNPVNNTTSLFATDDDNLFGWADIDGKTFRLHYFKNIYSEKQFNAKDSKEALNTILEQIIKNIDNLLLSEIDITEQKLGGTDFTQKHKMSPGDFYPNRRKYDLETPRIYRKQEDTIFTLYYQYYYSKDDNVVKYIDIEWKEIKPPPVKDMADLLVEQKKCVDCFYTKFDELTIYATKLFGKPKTTSLNRRGGTTINWLTKNGVHIILDRSPFERYREINLRIYKD